jgi:hypothetical protein
MDMVHFLKFHRQQLAQHRLLSIEVRQLGLALVLIL